MIGAGTEWEGAITKQLEEARVILLLISADFIRSKYCYDVEMARALERHDRREALVVPIILRAVSLNGTPLSVLPDFDLALANSYDDSNAGCLTTPSNGRTLRPAWAQARSQVA